MEESCHHWWKKVAAPSRLYNNEGLGAHSCDAGVRTLRTNGPQGGWLTWLDDRHQGSRWAFLPDTESQPANSRSRSLFRYVQLLNPSVCNARALWPNDVFDNLFIPAGSLKYVTSLGRSWTNIVSKDGENIRRDSRGLRLTNISRPSETSDTIR